MRGSESLLENNRVFSIRHEKPVVETESYNSLDQLVHVTRGQPNAEIILGQYDYNASGFRVRHRFSERDDVDYYYDETAKLEERNASDGSLLAHYSYANTTVYIDLNGYVALKPWEDSLEKSKAFLRELFDDASNSVFYKFEKKRWASLTIFGVTTAKITVEAPLDVVAGAVDIADR